jgi:hypothetical protein
MSKKPDAFSRRVELWATFIAFGFDETTQLPYPPFPELLGLSSLHQGGLGEPPTFAQQAALALNDTLISEPIKKSFEKFGLDSKNPFAWRFLLYIFAETFFGDHGSNRGAPKRWSDQRFCELLTDFDQIKARNPKLSDSAICTLLKKDKRLRATMRMWTPRLYVEIFSTPETQNETNSFEYWLAFMKGECSAHPGNSPPKGRKR